MCGVIGVTGHPEASKEAFLGLITLQHRGQDAAGILSFDGSFHLKKNLGLVEDIFTREDVEGLKGSVALGHTRYSTSGKGELQDVQPLVVNFPYGIGMVHNGNLVNYQSQKEKLQTEMRRRCLTASDTEVILNWFAHHLEGAEFSHLKKAAQSVFENLIGSYSIAGIVADGGLFAFRDPNGLRPLVLGKKAVGSKTAYMVASETLPLQFLGYDFVRDIKPGELIYIDKDLNLHAEVLQKVVLDRKSTPCMFEWVYFAGAEGEIETAPVYGTRLNLGVNLAQKIKTLMDRGLMDPHIVAPVPDTSRTAAIALAENLGISCREILIKNRYIKRTFILSSQDKREKAVDLKLNPVFSEIRGKNILLVDDSIVRGTTSKKIIELVRRAGANKVYFVSTCPPIRYPCFYGIDFPNPKELIATGRTEDQIAEYLGADAVIYQDMDGLKKSICDASNQKIKTPCTACLTGVYPTDIAESKALIEKRNTDRRTETRNAI